jgi:glycosyltransferase involved in cell wall biosynthesis
MALCNLAISSSGFLRVLSLSLYHDGAIVSAIQSERGRYVFGDVIRAPSLAGTTPVEGTLCRTDASEFPTQTIAYLTSQYGRSGDTFIRGEIEQLRTLGFTVHTFSIRTPSKDEMVSEAVRRERHTTEDLLGAGLTFLIGSTLVLAISRPLHLARALHLAIRIGTPGLRGRLWPIAYLLEAGLLARRMQSKGIKHLHNHIGQNSAAVAMLASVLSDIPYSLTVHGPTEFDIPMMLALDEKIGRSKFTVSISSFGRSQLMRWCATKHWNKIHVVRCGLLNEFKSAITTDVPDVGRFVYTARLVKDKGHLLLLEAIARLSKQGIKVELDLIGDGPLRSSIENAIVKRGLESHVRILGNRSSGEVRQIIESSRGFVSSSFAEGLPVALMEAMALARPVISTNVGAISELIEHRKHGWLVPAGSIDELAAALRAVLETPVERLCVIGREGRDRVLQLHDAGRETLKLALLITSCATSGNGRDANERA